MVLSSSAAGSSFMSLPPVFQKLLKLNVYPETFLAECIVNRLEFRRIHFLSQRHESLHEDVLGPRTILDRPIKCIFCLAAQLLLVVAVSDI